MPKHSRLPADDAERPLVADLTGIESKLEPKPRSASKTRADAFLLRCPHCRKWVQELYVTTRKLNRCATCLGRAVHEKKAVYAVG